jgi:hypothetical protein
VLICSAQHSSKNCWLLHIHMMIIIKESGNSNIMHILIKAILSSHITVGDSVMAVKPSSQVQNKSCWERNNIHVTYIWVIVFCSVMRTSIWISGVPVMLWTSWTHWMHRSQLSHYVPEKSVCSWLAASPFHPKPTGEVSQILSSCDSSYFKIHTLCEWLVTLYF